MPSMIGCHALVFTGEFDTRGIAEFRSSGHGRPAST